MKYDVYLDTYSGLYYLIPLEGAINERRILLTTAGLVRSSYRAGDVITSPAFVLAARNCVPKRSLCLQ